MKVNKAIPINQNKIVLPKNDPYLKVAQGMETQFARMLVDQMRKTTKPAANASEGFYRSLLDQKYAEAMSENSELGIKKLILEQIHPRYKAQALENYKKLQQAKDGGVTMEKPYERN